MDLTQNLSHASLRWLLVPAVAVSALQGEEPAASGASYDLPPYVVVATRTPLGLDRVSPSVSYISDEEMELWQDNGLADALRRQPGTAIVSFGSEGSQTSLFTRGTNSNHTSFFLDGRRMNPAFSNQFNLDVLPTGNLSSVQIQRGASSVNYGSNGIGGAINLRTRSGFDVSGPSGGIEVEIGSNDFRRGAFDAAFSEGNLALSAAGSWLETDNERPNDGFERLSATTRFDYRILDDLAFELVGQYADGDKEVPGSTVTPTPEQVNETEVWLLSPGFRYTTDELSVHLFYSRSETDLLNTEPGRRDEITFDSDEVSLQVDYSLTDSALLTLGGVYRRDEAADNNVAFSGPPRPFEETFDQAGGFAQLIWLPVDMLELRGGIRYDDYSDFGDEWTGDVEAIVYFEDTGLSVFTKYATSYSPPRTQDIAFDSDPATDPRPEESESVEIGLRQKLLGGKLKAEAVYFHNDIEDLLTFRFTGVGFSGFDVTNLDEAKTEGVEFSLDYRQTDKLDLGLAYTYLTAVDDESDDRLVRRPRHTLQLSADYRFTDSFRAGIRGTGYFDREDFQIAAPFEQVDSEDYFVVQLVADWEIDKNWSVFARVENLLDEEYEPTIGFPALGRAGYIGARFEF